MRLGKLSKQPTEKLDFDIDFNPWLVSCGDTAQQLAVEAEPGITIGPYDVVAGIAKVWVRGGTSGESYKVTVTLTTTGGRIKQVEVTVRVKDV